jgi:hypothetical protein
MCCTTQERLRNAIYNAPANHLIPSQMHFENSLFIFLPHAHTTIFSAVYMQTALWGRYKFHSVTRQCHTLVLCRWTHSISSTYICKSSYFPLSYVLPTADLKNRTHYDIHSVLLPIRRPTHKMSFIKRMANTKMEFWVRCEP